jgi:hypothetical protein
LNDKFPAYFVQRESAEEIARRKAMFNNMQEVDELNEIMEEIEPLNLPEAEHGGVEAGDERSVCTQLDDVRELLKAVDDIKNAMQRKRPGVAIDLMFLLANLGNKADKVRANIV